MDNSNTSKRPYDPNYYRTHKKQMMQNQRKWEARQAAITIRLKPARYEHYKMAAAASGMSFRAFLLEALDEKSNYKADDASDDDTE